MGYKSLIITFRVQSLILSGKSKVNLESYNRQDTLEFFQGIKKSDK